MKDIYFFYYKYHLLLVFYYETHLLSLILLDIRFLI